MSIVSTPHAKKVTDSLLELSLRKQQLKMQIHSQEAFIKQSTKQLFTFSSLLGLVFNSFQSKTNISDSFMAGFNIIKLIRSLFKSK